MVSEGGLSGLERGPGVGQTRPPSFHGGRSANNVIYRDEDIDTESAITSVSQQAENMRNSSRRPRIMSNGGTGSHNRQHVPRLPGSTYIFIYIFSFRIVDIPFLKFYYYKIIYNNYFT